MYLQINTVETFANRHQLKTRHHCNCAAILFWCVTQTRKKEEEKSGARRGNRETSMQKLSALIYCWWGIKKCNYWKKIWTPNNGNEAIKYYTIIYVGSFLFMVGRPYFFCAHTCTLSSSIPFQWTVFSCCCCCCILFLLMLLADRKSYNDLFIVFRMWLHFSSD